MNLSWCKVIKYACFVSKCLNLKETDSYLLYNVIMYRFVVLYISIWEIMKGCLEWVHSSGMYILSGESEKGLSVYN